MQVVIDNTKVQLNQSSLIGTGGEGNVYKAIVGGTQKAVKIYHQPSSARANKLQAFVSKNWLLPLTKVALPDQIVRSPKGQTIGLTMPFFGAGFEEIYSLSNKKYRAGALITTKSVTDVFLDGAKTLEKIHQNGLVVGDFNDLNALFRGKEMLFIDVDTWQFDSFPCAVATEQFLVPELYGVNLDTRPVFRPEYDWYSYAVMLFKSILCVHPYGGTYKGINRLTERAQRHIAAWNPDVIYPKIAYTPDLLNDDLADIFDQIFTKGKRGAFPVQVLAEYANSLVECSNCGVYYPRTRQSCPVCSNKTLVIISQPISVTKGVVVTHLIHTSGKIVFAKVIGDNIFVVAYENGKAILYTKKGLGLVKKLELFNEIAGARYELLGDKILIINPPNSQELLLVDISGSSIQPVLKTETAIYAPRRRAIFRTSDSYVFRIVNGVLMYSQVANGQLLERMLRNVLPDQTWFAVKQNDDGQRPTAFGFFQVGSEQHYWLVWEGRTYDNLKLGSLESKESLLDITVKFASQTVLIRRLTQQAGIQYIHTDIIDPSGNVVQSVPRSTFDEHQAPFLHGAIYRSGKLLHATDNGIVQEDIEKGNTKTFDSTAKYVAQGYTLFSYLDGLVAVSDSQVSQLVLTS